jgi:hypothetical protein
VNARVYVIGAGASVPSGLPTLKNLTWELCDWLTGTERDLLLNAIYESFGARLGRDPSPDFEELLNRLEPQALFYLEDTGVGGPNSPRQQAARIAIKGLREFIRERCLTIADKKSPYYRLVESVDVDSTIISFNWDVLLEHAFYRIGRPFSYLPSESSKGGVLILKPHGSISWFALLDRELLMLDTSGNFECLGDGLRDYMLHLKDPLGPMDFAHSSPFLIGSVAKMPAIVPPNATRLLSVAGVPRDDFVQAGHERVMKRTWREFKVALDCAEEMVVIGYSLPGTDAASIELFKHFAATNGSRKRRVLLVEPSQRVEERYKDILRIDVRVVCSDFEQFDPKRMS